MSLLFKQFLYQRPIGTVSHRHFEDVMKHLFA